MAISALSQFHPLHPSIMLDVDRESRVPLYEQLRVQLGQAIREGRLDPSEPLPPEPELAADLGVSRFTLRQALGQLVHEGLLRRQRGRGTFAVEPSEAVCVGRTGQRLGLAAEIEIVEVRSAHPSSDVAAVLGLAPTDRVVEIVQRRFVDGHAVAVEQIMLDERLLPMAALIELDGGDLYDLLERHSATQLTGARETVRALPLDSEAASLLYAEPGAPTLVVERQACAGLRVIELRRTIFAAASGAIELRLARADLSA